MQSKRTRFLVVTVAIAALVGACSGSGSTLGPSGSAADVGGSARPSMGDPATDKLASILSRGTLVLSTDGDYAPQSSLVSGAVRPADTLCAPNQLTAAEVEGYDTDTGQLVAKALGVEPCFVTPKWSEVTAGNWGDHWDVAWGSGALTADRMKGLYVTQPYYSTPHGFFVPTGSPIQNASDLSGLKVGACAGCTHELYLKHELVLPGQTVTYLVDDPEIVTFDAEPPGLAATAAGELDAFLCGQPVGDAAIADGAALRMLPTPAYVTQKTGYLDKGSQLSQTAFAARIDGILLGLHADGTLKALSERHFGVDYATAAGQFDMTTLDQVVE